MRAFTTLQKEYLIVLIYTDRDSRICVGREIQSEGQWGKEHRLDQAEFIDVDPVSKDSGFNVAVQGL